MAAKEKAFQDSGSVPHCYGCGADNENGLRIKSKWDGDEAVCVWRPESHHCGGSKEIVNGGIIATLIDCHSLNLAVANGYREEGRPIGSSPTIAYVTGNLSVSYLRPAPIRETIELRARIEKIEGRKVWVSCTLSAAGQICARGEVLGIRVNQGKSKKQKR